MEERDDIEFEDADFGGTYADADQPGESLQTTEDDQGEGGIAVSGAGDMVIGGFAFTPTALVPVDPNAPPNFEQWDSVGTFLRYVHTGTQFWLGDWLNYGEANYGEKYAQAVEHTGYELHTLQTYAWVARQVPHSNRLEAVPFGHYANGIAAIKDPGDQLKWAKKVADEGMTQAALRDALTTERAARKERPTDLWLVVKCNDQKDFDALEKKMRNEGREVTSRVTAQKAVKPTKVGVKAGTKKTAADNGPKPKLNKATSRKRESGPVAPAAQDEPDITTATTDVAPVDETPEQKKKRIKKAANERFRAKQRAAKAGQA